MIERSSMSMRNKQQRTSTRRRKGAILSLMVVLTLLLTMMSLALAHLGQQSRLRTIRTTNNVIARLAADAGIERALYLMNQELAAGSWTVGDVPVFESEPLAACNASYSVTFSGNLSGGYELVSTGVCGSQTRTLRVLIGLSSPFSDDFAVLTEGQLTMKNNTRVDGFNSADPSETDVAVSIGTLSNQDDQIDLGKNTVIDGDLYVGPGGNPDTVVTMKDRQSVTGELFTMAAPYSMPTIDVPDFVGSKGKIEGNTISLGTASSGRYDSISINNNGQLEVSGNVVLHVTGDIELKNGAELKVNNGAILKLYVDGDVSAKNSAGINNAGKIPGNVRIYGTGADQTFELKNNTDFYGVLYAPNAEMTLHNNGNAYGSFIAETFELKNNGNIYYDKALRNVTLTDEGIRFTVLRWEEL